MLAQCHYRYWYSRQVLDPIDIENERGGLDVYASLPISLWKATQRFGRDKSLIIRFLLFYYSFSPSVRTFPSRRVLTRRDADLRQREGQYDAEEERQRGQLAVGRVTGLHRGGVLTWKKNRLVMLQNY